MNTKEPQQSYINLPKITNGEGNGTLLQHSCLENPVDRGAWQAAIHRVAKSWTRLSDFTLVLRHILLFSRYGFSPHFLSLLFFGNSYFSIHVLGLFILSSLLTCLIFSVQVSFWIMSLEFTFQFAKFRFCVNLVWFGLNLGFSRGDFTRNLSLREQLCC